MREIERVYINCPVCGSGEYEIAYQKDFEVYMNDERYKWPTQQVLCRKCGFIYTNPQPSKEILNLYYETTYNTYGASSQVFREQQLSFLMKHIARKVNTIFEIGSFDGTFLYLARNKGGFEIHGIEPSQGGVKRAADLYGIELEKAFFDKKYVDKFLKQGREKFDVVCFFHVYEHISNPLEFLKLVLNVVKPDGYIFIEVPNAENPFLENIADFFSIEHLNHFTEIALKNIASVLDFDIVAFDKPKDISVLRVIYKISNNDKINKTIKLENDFENIRKVMKKYVKDKYHFLEKIKNKLKYHDKIIIYGAGMHTSQLLTQDLFDIKKIKYIVDSDRKKWGKKLFGLKIFPPNILKEENLPVLISSYDSQEEIANYVSKNFPNISQIKLYDKVVSYNKGTYDAV